MTDKLPPDQGRAPCLYGEQLQRLQQEKMLLQRRGREERPDLLDSPPSAKWSSSPPLSRQGGKT
ncbi:MAG TPA: hypothetical protein VGA98_09270, partial [Allosphingosinicella sp.]